MVSPELLAKLEAVLFASDAALPLERLAEALESGPEEVRLALAALGVATEAPGRGLALVEVAGGYRLVTRPEVAPALLRLQRLRLRARLSRAAVETLAIVAYRQPVSRPEIEQLRGVNADHVLTALLERRLVRVVGRRAVPGRPLLYGTTREFLEHFGLRDLGELPPFEVPGEAAAALAAAVSTAPMELGGMVEADGPEAAAGETATDEAAGDEAGKDEAGPDEALAETARASEAAADDGSADPEGAAPGGPDDEALTEASAPGAEGCEPGGSAAPEEPDGPAGTPARA